MVRTAVKTLTLNVYAIRTPAVQAFVASRPAAAYFTELATYVAEQCQVRGGARVGLPACSLKLTRRLLPAWWSSASCRERVAAAALVVHAVQQCRHASLPAGPACVATSARWGSGRASLAPGEPRARACPLTSQLALTSRPPHPPPQALDRLLCSWDVSSPQAQSGLESCLAEVEDLLSYCNDVLATGAS